MLPNSSIFRWQLYLVSNIKLSFSGWRWPLSHHYSRSVVRFLSARTHSSQADPDLCRGKTLCTTGAKHDHIYCPNSAISSSTQCSTPFYTSIFISTPPPLKIKGTHIQTYKVQDKSSLDPKSHSSAISETLFCVSFHTTCKKNSRTYFQVSSVPCYHRVSCSRLEVCSVHRMLFSLGVAITSIKKATTLIQWGVTSLSRQAHSREGGSAGRWMLLKVFLIRFITQQNLTRSM